MRVTSSLLVINQFIAQNNKIDWRQKFPSQNHEFNKVEIIQLTNDSFFNLKKLRTFWHPLALICAKWESTSFCFHKKKQIKFFLVKFNIKMTDKNKLFHQNFHKYVSNHYTKLHNSKVDTKKSIYCYSDVKVKSSRKSSAVRKNLRSLHCPLFEIVHNREKDVSNYQSVIQASFFF